MLNIVVAVLPFVMFILYDVNSVKWEIAVFRKLFLIGVVLIIINTIVIIINNYTLYSAEIVYAAPALLCLCMLIYSLFFALPFQDTYTAGKNPSNLCKTGIYAMCRHPGAPLVRRVLPVLSLSFPYGELAVFSFVSCMSNSLFMSPSRTIGVFPRTFSDYHG